MGRRLIPFVLCLLGLFFGACSATPTPSSAPQPTFTFLPGGPISFPKIDRHPAAADFQRTVLPAMPTYNPAKTDGFQVDLRSWDLSQLDLSNSLADLMYADFDTQTQWPAAGKMPAGFDWQTILENAKNPGLGIRALHDQGITGQSVGIAIIDQPILVDHQEYTDQLRLYEEIGVDPGAEAQMHGPAVASIAAGDTTGVAPGADLYYIGSTTGVYQGYNFTFDFRYYAQAIRRVLDINAQLPADRKIRVISMQIGWSPGQIGYDDINAAVAEAKAAGILVVSSSLEETFGFKFNGLGRDPLADPDQFTSYQPGLFWADSFFASPSSDRLLVPMDSRTTAGPSGNDEYVFYRSGGWSWSIPYIAGVYALAAQVKPSVTPDEFWTTAITTGATIQIQHGGANYSLGPILNPAGLIAMLLAK